MNHSRGEKDPGMPAPDLHDDVREDALEVKLAYAIPQDFPLLPDELSDFCLVGNSRGFLVRRILANRSKSSSRSAREYPGG
jgi:hypothetical protein